MEVLKIGVYRIDRNSQGMIGLPHHKTRAKLLHAMVDSLDLTVKDWGNTNDEKPHEYVEIIIALGTAGVFTAMVTMWKAWLDKGKIAEVTLVMPDGSYVTIKKGTIDDVVKFVKATGAKFPTEPVVNRKIENPKPNRKKTVKKIQKR